LAGTGYIEKGIEESADFILDERDFKVEECPNGFFVDLTVLVATHANVQPGWPAQAPHTPIGIA